MKHEITFRPISEEDQDFLRQVYASTRTDELAILDWSEAQKQDFLNMQFHAQHTFYMQQFPEATFDIVLLREQPIGRLYVHRPEHEIRLIDIALLPEYRNDGIGTALLQDLLAEATETGKPLSIHVEKFNPAMRLYERLGFTSIADQGVYLLMEWRPES